MENTENIQLQSDITVDDSSVENKTVDIQMVSVETKTETNFSGVKTETFVASKEIECSSQLESIHVKQGDTVHIVIKEKNVVGQDQDIAIVETIEPSIEENVGNFETKDTPAVEVEINNLKGKVLYIHLLKHQ